MKYVFTILFLISVICCQKGNRSESAESTISSFFEKKDYDSLVTGRWHVVNVRCNYQPGKVQEGVLKIVNDSYKGAIVLLRPKSHTFRFCIKEDMKLEYPYMYFEGDDRSNYRNIYHASQKTKILSINNKELVFLTLEGPDIPEDAMSGEAVLMAFNYCPLLVKNYIFTLEKESNNPVEAVYDDPRSLKEIYEENKAYDDSVEAANKKRH